MTDRSFPARLLVWWLILKALLDYPREDNGSELRGDLELASQKTAQKVLNLSDRVLMSKFAQYSSDAVDGHCVTALVRAQADGSSKVERHEPVRADGSTQGTDTSRVAESREEFTTSVGLVDRLLRRRFPDGHDGLSSWGEAESLPVTATNS